jgi:hypothetical protein
VTTLAEPFKASCPSLHKADGACGTTSVFRELQWTLQHARILARSVGEIP